MAKKIKFTYNDRAYTLEYNRNSVRMLEKQGFRIDLIEAQPETMITMLFAGAFIMHHRNIVGNTKLIEEMFRKFPNRDELITHLVDMYQEPVLALFDEPEEDEGNIQWESEE